MNPQIDNCYNPSNRAQKEPKASIMSFLLTSILSLINRSLCAVTDRMMNKYKKMRMEVLSYIVANEKSIIKRLNK